MIFKFTEYTVHDNLRYLITLLFERRKRFHRFRFHPLRKNYENWTVTRKEQFCRKIKNFNWIQIRKFCWPIKIII